MLCLFQGFAQENPEKIIVSHITRITNLFSLAQVTHTKSIAVPKGESTFRFTGLSLFIKPESIKVIASGDLHILSVKLEQHSKNKNASPVKDIVVKVSSDKAYLSTFKLMYSVSEAFLNESKHTDSFFKINDSTQSISISRLTPYCLTYYKPLPVQTKPNNVIRDTASDNKINDTLPLKNEKITKSETKESLPIVRGTITEEKTGEPLPGVRISIKGTSINTATDFDGNYTIRLPNNDSNILVIKSIGYKTLEIPVDSTVINAKMEVANSLEEPIIFNEVAIPPRNPRKEEVVEIRKSTALPFPQKPCFDKNKQPKKAKLQKHIRTKQVDGQTGLNYIIKTPYRKWTSNGKKLIIPVIAFDTIIDYKYIAAPKINSYAYFIANINDWKQYNINTENNAGIDSLSVSENLNSYTNNQLQVFLGVDKDIQIERKRIKKTSRNRFWNTKRIDTRKWRIRIKNNKTVPVTIEVHDQVPVSNSTEIEIIVHKLSGGKLDSDTGEVVWHLQVPAGKKKDLILQYTVKHPKKDNNIIE